MADNKYLSILNGYVICDDEARERITTLENKGFVKEFTKEDFTQVAKAQRYYIAIPQREHKLAKPFVEKVILSKTADSEENNSYMVATVCETRLLSTGTIKVYITIDLSGYTEYNGKIYLKGE